MDATDVTKIARRLIARHKAARAHPVQLWASVTQTRSALTKRLTEARAELPDNRLLILVCTPAQRPAVDLEGVRIVLLPAKAFKALHPRVQRRYRVLRGGRGSAKSWSIARALVLRALASPIRILCAREYQKSIAESSHKLLSDVIESLGLSAFFDIKNTSIECSNGSEFLFEGLHSNVTKVKSLEGIDLCWVEEAARIAESSWTTLIPTIRQSNSEIWVSFNPEETTDPTFVRFVTKPPPAALVEELLWSDNPFFPAELELERAYLESVDVEAHAHVWGGQCRTVSDAQVFRGKYCIQSFDIDPTWSGPHQGADWGFSVDPSVLIRCYIDEVNAELYISHEAYAVGCDIDKTPELFDTVPNARSYVTRADSARPETISYMQKNGYSSLVPCTKWENCAEDGVAWLRGFRRIVVDPKCIHVAQEMRLYAYKTDRLTNAVLPELLDKNNHCIDAIRYALEQLIKAGGAAALLSFYAAETKRQPVATAQPAAAPSMYGPHVAVAPAANALQRPQQPVVCVESQSPWQSEDGRWR